VIVAVRSLNEIPEGEEFFAHYAYSFDSAPPWYKDLFLKFMEDHPEKKMIIQKIAKGRTREELEKVYEDYLNVEPINDAEVISAAETMDEEKGKEEL
jgi:hypothetical protein